MIGRPALVAQLDLAVGSRPVTLLQGLPRVGRTQLIDEWMKRRTDARRETDPAATRWHVLPAFPLWDLFDWLARRNSNELDETVTQFGKRQELKSGIFVLEKLGLIRRLANAAISVCPDKDFKDKLFVRDTGLLHAMIGVVTTDDLEHSKAIGSSFESYAIEALIAAAGTAECRARYYRFGDGQGADEIDLILQFPTQQGRQIAIECKVGPSKSARPGFFRACGLMGITEQLVVHSGPDADRSERIPRLDLRSAIKRVAEIAVGR